MDIALRMLLKNSIVVRMILLVETTSIMFSNTVNGRNVTNNPRFDVVRNKITFVVFVNI